MNVDPIILWSVGSAVAALVLTGLHARGKRFPILEQLLDFVVNAKPLVGVANGKVATTQPFVLDPAKMVEKEYVGHRWSNEPPPKFISGVNDPRAWQYDAPKPKAPVESELLAELKKRIPLPEDTAKPTIDTKPTPDGGQQVVVTLPPGVKALALLALLLFAGSAAAQPALVAKAVPTPKDTPAEAKPEAKPEPQGEAACVCQCGCATTGICKCNPGLLSAAPVGKHTPPPATYGQAYRRAKELGVPLVVYVGRDADKVPNAVSVRDYSGTFGTGPSVIVGKWDAQGVLRKQVTFLGDVPPRVVEAEVAGPARGERVVQPTVPPAQYSPRCVNGVCR